MHETHQNENTATAPPPAKPKAQEHNQVKSHLKPCVFCDSVVDKSLLHACFRIATGEGFEESQPKEGVFVASGMYQLYHSVQRK